MKKEAFQQLVTSRVKFTLFLLKSLPAAWFMGFRMHALTEEQGAVSLPYGWRSKNPFKSTYFAAQIAAAEMSTGMLVMLHLQEKPAFSMLVVGTEGKFLKKADQTLVFTCTQGKEVCALIDKLAESNAGETITLTSVGRLPSGEIASEFTFTWSLKKKQSR